MQSNNAISLGRIFLWRSKYAGELRRYCATKKHETTFSLYFSAITKEARWAMIEIRVRLG